MHTDEGMRTLISALILSMLLATTAVGQTVPADPLAAAQQTIRAAEVAEASTYARALYEDAQYRLRFAQEHWSSQRREEREDARLRAVEALWAARAALARSQWLSTNATIRSLERDITRFGGRSEITLVEESAALDLERGPDSDSYIRAAEAAIEQAVAAGGDQIPGNELATARSNVATARTITRNNKRSESANHLAFVAEMMARQAYYLARASESSRFLPALQSERARLEQAAPRPQPVLQDSVAQEREARIEAERRLDEMIRNYQTALANSTTAEAEALRRQVEEQRLALRTMQERERMNEQAMQSEIERLRSELENVRREENASTQRLEERQAELRRREEEYQRLRREREAELSRRTELERQQQAAIAEAQRRRQEAEVEARQLTQQVEQAREQTQQTQAELEEARRQAQATQAELERAKLEIAQRDLEARRLRLQTDLAQLAATRAEERGIIVTIPGASFDSGRAVVKPAARATLRRIAEQLRDNETVRIVVEGHTDSVGSAELNQQLSERRAAAVFDVLVSAGVPVERVTALGRGQNQPIATNDTAAGRAQNRRVELVITNQ